MSVPINCEGCAHHRPLSRTYTLGIKCCHYLLDTGKQREKNGDICLSWSETRTPKKNMFEVPPQQM